MLNEFRNKQPYELSANETSSPIEDSWIYTFCIKCRGEDTQPAWEPPMWQRFCPFPLCPSFRQFARLWCIIIIGITTSFFFEFLSRMSISLSIVFRCNCLVCIACDCRRCSQAWWTNIRFNSANCGCAYWRIFNVINQFATIDWNACHGHSCAGSIARFTE